MSKSIARRKKIKHLAKKKGDETTTQHVLKGQKNRG